MSWSVSFGVYVRSARARAVDRNQMGCWLARQKWIVEMTTD